MTGTKIEKLKNASKAQRVDRVLHLLRQLRPGWYHYLDIQGALGALYPTLDAKTERRLSPEDSVWNALNSSDEVAHGEHGSGLWGLKAWKRIPEGRAAIDAADQVSSAETASEPPSPRTSYGTSRAPRFWWVNQQHFEERRHLKCLWAPLEGAGGRTVPHWKSLSEARIGDMVFSYADQAIKAVSRVVADPVEEVYPNAEDEELGWKVDVEYTILPKPVPKADFIDHPGLPINSRGRANQGYFYPLGEPAGKYLLGLTGLEATAVVPAAHTGKRNPPWRREELVLALAYYMAHPLSEHSASNPGIIELSEILNNLPFHLDRPDAGRFRNPNGCEMKLCNFRAFDPSYDGKGLDAGSKLDKATWDEFYGDQERLQLEAASIRTLAVDPGVVDQVMKLQEEDRGHPEGDLKSGFHRYKERDAALVKKAKKLWGPDPKCEVCNGSFGQLYPGWGDGYIEAHHRVPLAELTAETENKPEDLAPVCANCHRMLHLKSGKSIDALRATVAARKETSAV